MAWLSDCSEADRVAFGRNQTNYYKENMTLAARRKLNYCCGWQDASCMGGYVRTRFHCHCHEQSKPHPTKWLYDSCERITMTSKERHEARYQRRRAARERARLAVQPTLEQVYSFDNLYRAYRLCCNGVLWKASVQSYKANALVNVRRKQLEILAGNERARGFVEFDICDRGKQRHIMSCHISDRVSQRCLCDNCLVPLLSRSFVYDNGASLRGRGMDFALNRMNVHLHRHYRRQGSNEGYILFIDFKKFFGNINHATAKEAYRKAIVDDRLYDKACEYVDCYGDVGLGLGAMSSQITALCVPNELDHHIKEKLKIKGFGRYMDDVYCIHKSKEYLQECLSEIKAVCARLGIPLNLNKTRIVKLSKGFTFLKVRYKLTKSGAVIRKPCKKSVTRMRRKLRTFRGWVDKGRMSAADVLASFTSWRGCLLRCRSYRTLRSTEFYFNKLFAGYAKITNKRRQLCTG